MYNLCANKHFQNGDHIRYGSWFEEGVQGDKECPEASPIPQKGRKYIKN